MWRIDLSRQAADTLLGLSAKHARQVAEKLKVLGTDPNSLPSQSLKGYAPMRRLKAGKYRIIYALADGAVQVRLIGKSNDDEIYKLLERSTR